MYINKNNVKRVLATAVAIVTTGIPSIANASFYQVKGDEQLYDICEKVYGNSNYFGELIKYNEMENGYIYDGMFINLPELEDLEDEINISIDYNSFSGVSVDCDLDGNILGLYVPRVNGGIGYINTIGYFNMNMNPSDMIFSFTDIDLTKIKGLDINYSKSGVCFKIPTINGMVDVMLNCSSKETGYISRFDVVDSLKTMAPTMTPTATPRPTATPTMVPTATPRPTATATPRPTPTTTPSVMFVGSPAEKCLRYLGNYSSYYISENLKVVNGKITSVYLKANNDKGFVSITDYTTKLDFESIDLDYYSNGEVDIIRNGNSVFAIGIKRYDNTYDYIVLDSSFINNETVRNEHNHSTEYRKIVNIDGSSLFNGYSFSNNNSYNYDYSSNNNYDAISIDYNYDYSNNNSYDFNFDNNTSYSAYEDYSTPAPTINPKDKAAVKADIITRSNLEIIGDETIWYLCKKYYNNGNYYKKVLQFNGYKESKKLTRGTKIYFPPLEELLDFCKRFKSENNNVYVKKLHA